MQLLYKAIACKELDGKKYLFPGYPPRAVMKELKPGDRTKVQQQDGTFAETAVRGTKPCIFDQNLIDKLNLPVQSGFYFAIEVPPNFDASGNVYLIDLDEQSS